MSTSTPQTERRLLGQRQPLLLVEDDAPLRQMLSWDLADLGYDVSAAVGCVEARRLVGRTPFRFALIDVRLPDGDGRDLAAELTACSPALHVVLMSGDHAAHPAAQPEQRIHAFLTKPVDIGIIHRLFTAAVGMLRPVALQRPTVFA